MDNKHLNIKEELLKEHSKAQTTLIVDYIGHKENRFAELMELFLTGDYQMTQRAAWPMSYVARKYPDLFWPYFKKVLQYLSQPHVHNAVVRNSLRVLQDLDIPEWAQGELVDICLSFVQDPKQQGAIKAFSITVLKNICKSYPELVQEVALCLKERLPFEKPAFLSRAKDFLNQFPN